MLFSRFGTVGLIGILTAGVMGWSAIEEAAAQIVAPSTWTTEIQVQGEDAGAEFNDWAEVSIPLAVADPSDNLPGIDIDEIQIANDADYIYIRTTLHNTTDIELSNLFIAFDTDQNTSTGYNIFGLSVIGSEIGYQFDYPFQQEFAVFNTGVEGVVEYGGDFIGLAVTYPYWQVGPPAGTQIEYAIPRDLAIGPTAPGISVFKTDSFNFMFWTDQGPNGDVSEVISYTLATFPGLPGDFDGDIDVDGNDFLIWQINYPDGSGGDADRDGDSDQDDLLIWKNNFGTGSVSGGAIPEPECAVLVMVGICFALLRRPCSRLAV